MSTDLSVFSKLYLRLGVARLGEVLFSHEKNVILKTLFRVIYTKQKKNKQKRNNQKVNKIVKHVWTSNNHKLLWLQSKILSYWHQPVNKV